ncbi:hypothetical protein PVAP13_4NG305200 [Panicum virgatum]|uniref:Alpha-1,3/1,6-mannosyltransferase ALG2 n=1 Tax=Panicum virgatum TaxID=38727 RepID=A0A8T0TF48_PANVG|nr:hypothetical protein PVAP13_4NG305200 [Panicum virgatum]
MAAAGGVAGESSATKTKRLRVAVIRPDLGMGTPSSPSLIVLSDPWAGCGRVPSLAEDPGTRRKLVRLGVLNFCAGGAERLIVDVACQLAAHGHDVHVFTAHHDKNRCFEETVSCLFPVTVYGDFLPHHVFYRFHAVCAYLRCLFVALCVLLQWPSFDVIVVDQVSVVIPLLKLKSSSKVVFYCHFPDMLLAQHTSMIRRLYRKPIDIIEEATTGMADLILVNSKFTAATFARTFRLLHTRGIEPAILHPAVSVEQFHEPHAYKLNFLSINRFERKKNLDLAISAFSLTLPGDALQEATLTVAGGYDMRLKENVEYLEELKRLAVTEGVSEQVKFVTSCSTSKETSFSPTAFVFCTLQRTSILALFLLKPWQPISL